MPTAYAKQSEAGSSWLFWLEDPRSGQVRFVGATSRLRFLREELPERGRWAPLRGWRAELQAAGLRPKAVILAVLDPSEAKASVSRLVKLLAAKGQPLLNPRAQPPPLRKTEARRASELALLKQQPAKILDPLLPGKTQYTRSRIAVFADGTPLSMLLLLAGRRYGKAPSDWEADEVFPFWIDGNHLNETEDNVGLALRRKAAATQQRASKAAAP